MLIGILDYYPINFLNSDDGLREDGNLRFLELYKKGKENNIIFEKYNKSNHRNYDLIFFQNEPRIHNIIAVLFRNIIIRKIDIYYMADETPIARKRLSLIFPKIYKKILINTIKGNIANKKSKYFLYRSASIPEKEKILARRNFILKKRNRLFCYVGSNKLFLNKKGTYLFRNKILQALTKYKEFSLYGKNWDQTVLPIDLPFYQLIIRSKFLKKLFLNYYRPRFPLMKNKGSIRNKIDMINKYKFTLAIEPFIGDPKMVLEKIFDPMLAGSIPVYYGNSDIDIPDNTYIRINKNVNPEYLINFLKSFKEEEIADFRFRIYEFLLSDKAKKFRYQYFALDIIDLLKKEIN